MDFITAKDFVRSRYPRAVCHGPVNILCCAEGENVKRFVILGDPTRQLGEGETEEAAWANVAKTLKETSK